MRATHTETSHELTYTRSYIADCGGGGCGGSGSERVDTCCPVDGKWTDWGEFGDWLPSTKGNADNA